MMFPETRTILIYCEESGVFADLYRAAGYNVIVRDLKFGENNDVRFQEYHDGPVYGFLAFPPCTHLAGSGARWWQGKGKSALAEALAIADACLRVAALYSHTLAFWMVENPVGRLSRFYGPPRMTFQPHQYAGWSQEPEKEAYTKRTCLWGKFTIPPPKPVENTMGSLMWKLPPSENRAEMRSKTPYGFARAFFTYNK